MGISLKQLFPQFNPDTEQVSDGDFRNQSKINSLFQLLLDENTVLKIRFQDTKTLYSSCIIALDQKKSLFTLDELHPADGHRLLASTGTFIGHAIIKGVNVSFHTSLIKLGRNGQFNCYECDIPHSISYVQRRQEYRVRIHDSHMYKVFAQHKGSTHLLQGKIHDVSMKGIAIDIKTSQSIKPGEQLTNCKLELSKNDSVTFSLDVCHIESTQPGVIRVGGQFREITSRAEELICKFVRDMERLSIRNS